METTYVVNFNETKGHVMNKTEGFICDPVLFKKA